jgi:hypothetical protein
LEHPSTEELAESDHSWDGQNILENPNKALLKRVWVSEKGWCRLLDKELLEPIRGNSFTAQLAFEELTKDGSERMWGPLIEEVTSWDQEAQELLRRRYGADVLYVGSAELMVQDAEEETWHGPSCGVMPETVGEVKVTLRRLEGDPGEQQLELRIKASGESDWLQPTFLKPGRAPTPENETEMTETKKKKKK